MQKYEFTEETLTWHGGHTLRRIRAVQDFLRVRAGDLGGWIESEHSLSQEGNCWVANEAKVYGGARVRDSALVDKSAIACGTCLIDGDSRVTDEATVWCQARITDRALVRDSAIVTDSAFIFNNAIISGHAIVQNQACVFERALVQDRAVVGEEVLVFDDVIFQGTIRVGKRALVCGPLTVVIRSDGVSFCCVESREGPRIMGGGYYLSMEEVDNTVFDKETKRIVEALKLIYKVEGVV